MEVLTYRFGIRESASGPPVRATVQRIPASASARMCLPTRESTTHE